MPYSEYLRRRALVLHSRGLTARAIVDSLADEGLRATPQGIAKFLRRVQDTGTLERQPGSGRPSSVTPLIQGLVESQMRRDDETTAVQLHALLRRHGHIFFSFDNPPQPFGPGLDVQRQCVLPDDSSAEQGEAFGLRQGVSARGGWRFRGRGVDRRNIDTARDTPSVLLPETGRAPQPQAQVSASDIT